MMNRETWLEGAMAALHQEFFTENGYELPEKLQVSCGFPYKSSRAIGQCWSPSASADETTQMFISPTESDPVSVINVLLHEMIHACVGTNLGHKGPFRKLAKEFGLSGKMTATHAEEGSELFMKMKIIIERLGAYPHAAMNKRDSGGGGGGGEPEGEAGGSGGAGGGSGWVRLVSVSEKTYTLMISPRKLEEFGYPVDPWGEELVSKV